MASRLASKRPARTLRFGSFGSRWQGQAGLLLMLVGFLGYRLAWALPHSLGAFGIISGVPYHVPTAMEAACSGVFALGWSLALGWAIAGWVGRPAGLLLGLVSYAAVGFGSTLWQILRAGEAVLALSHPYVAMMALTWPERLAAAWLSP